MYRSRPDVGAQPLKPKSLDSWSVGKPRALGFRASMLGRIFERNPWKFAVPPYCLPPRRRPQIENQPFQGLTTSPAHWESRLLHAHFRHAARTLSPTVCSASFCDAQCTMDARRGRCTSASTQHLRYRLLDGNHAATRCSMVGRPRS